MISLAITTYNRSDLVIESFINVLNNDIITDIVIIDDCSDITIYENLRKLIMSLNHKKIRLIRNKHNIGVYLNKINAIKRSYNKWVILLDSDNVINNDYIKKITSLQLEDNILYCPSVLYDVTLTNVQWDYSEFCGKDIDRFNITDYVYDSNFQTSLNTSNHFFNRQTMLEAQSRADVDISEISGGDSCYTSYLWLLSDNKINIVDNLYYGHRIHEGSFYIKHADKSIKFNDKIIQRMKELKPPEGGFIVNKEFDLMIKTSYDYNQQAYDSEPRWKVLEEMYNKNFLDVKDRSNQILPKKIHQIWLGGEIPDKYKRMTHTWRDMNPEWEYKLWTDNDVKSIDLPNRRLFDSMTNYGPKSDLLRYHIMNKYGGVYADTDFECLKPFHAFTHLEFFMGIAYQSKLELYPGLIGCIPHHPISEALIKEVCKIKTMPNSPTGVLETISSYFFTRVFWSVISSYTEGVVAFPPDYFYPFPNDRGYKKRDGHACIKDCSYALHHWATSWIHK